MTNNVPDYKNNLYFEPDYSIYETARKIKKLAKERNFKIYRNELKQITFFKIHSILINIKDRTFVTYGCEEYIVKAKSNKHLVDIIEVLTRS